MTRSSLRTYLFLLRTFRNGIAIIQNLRHGGYLSHGPTLDRLIFWNGREIVHPAHRSGLLPVLLELWYENAYRIGDFYEPRPDEVIVDVGAHVGLFTLLILADEPHSKVVALEPSGENFECLKQNVALLAPQATVSLHNIGIGGAFGKGRMEEIPTNRSFDARTLPATDDDATIDLVPLRHLFNLAGTDRLSLLKMDAEGGEYEAFVAADDSVFPKIERLVMEYHDNYVGGTSLMLQDRLASTHEVTLVPDPGQLTGHLFAVRKDLAEPLHPKPPS
jgi:FkbM family methyltransferase